MAIALATILAAGFGAALGEGVKLMEGTTVEFVSAEDAARILRAKDDFIRAQSPFDRAARMKTDKDVSEDEFLEFVARQARAWTKDEIASVTKTLASAGRKLSSLGVKYPEKVLLIKTSGKEEGNAAYTRGNAIVIPARMAARLGEDTLMHELFHIYSRANPLVRKDLYGIIGFAPCGEVELPQSVRPRRITNPDAPLVNCRIDLTADGKKVKAVPVLLSRQAKYDPRRGGEFFQYLVFSLMQVEEKDGKFVAAMDDKGAPRLLDPDETDYVGKVGGNTEYIIHPEEILADNFVILANAGGKPAKVPTPSIPEAMRKVLAAKAAKGPAGPATEPASDSPAATLFYFGDSALRRAAGKAPAGFAEPCGPA